MCIRNWPDTEASCLCRDLSYWGFQQLAHPLNGIMMTEFRPVSCDTHEPLNFDPGFINSTIYGDKVETGWAWFPYKQNTDNFWLPVCGFPDPCFGLSRPAHSACDHSGCQQG